MADLPAGIAIKTVTAFMIVHIDIASSILFRQFLATPQLYTFATVASYSATRIWQLQNRMLLAGKRSRG